MTKKRAHEVERRHRIRVRRVYEPPEPADGTRVLVDRLWPRGLAKEAAALDEWLKDAAPSAELRGWYGHDPRRFEEFAERYGAELAAPDHARALGRLSELAAENTLTLLTATKDLRYSHAPLLAAEVRRGQDPDPDPDRARRQDPDPAPRRGQAPRQDQDPG